MGVDAGRNLLRDNGYYRVYCNCSRGICPARAANREREEGRGRRNRRGSKNVESGLHREAPTRAGNGIPRLACYVDLNHASFLTTDRLTDTGRHAHRWRLRQSLWLVAAASLDTFETIVRAGRRGSVRRPALAIARPFGANSAAARRAPLAWPESDPEDDP
jgi:hypothetical protein